MLGRSKIRRFFNDVWLEDEETEADLWELANMSGRNQLGSHDAHCVFDRVNDFARGEKWRRAIGMGEWSEDHGSI